MECKSDDMRNSIRELQVQIEALRKLTAPITPAEELLKQLDIKRQIEASDASKAVRDMFDNYNGMLRPPPLPDGFSDESEEDSEI